MHQTCVIIPIYNNKDTIAAVLDRIAAFDLPCLIVDDGSDAETRDLLDREAAARKRVRVKHREKNGGKGAAVRDAIYWAESEGYDDAVQVDADGQHKIEDIPLFLTKASRYPGSLILGAPIFGEDVPKARLYGRELSKFWVRVETLSRAVKDPLFGFRLYPVRATAAVFRNEHVGDRMDFDPEIAVRLYWNGIKVHNIDTPVIYPEDGISHFRMVRDNVRLTWMHIRLVVGMLPRAPKLLSRGR